eukprot:scaffold3134_cov414-Prasinococcus_capsulatus_cf.AAC.2
MLGEQEHVAERARRLGSLSLIHRRHITGQHSGTLQSLAICGSGEGDHGRDWLSESPRWQAAPPKPGEHTQVPLLHSPCAPQPSATLPQATSAESAAPHPTNELASTSGTAIPARLSAGNAPAWTGGAAAHKRATTATAAVTLWRLILSEPRSFRRNILVQPKSRTHRPHRSVSPGSARASASGQRQQRLPRAATSTLTTPTASKGRSFLATGGAAPCVSSSANPALLPKVMLLVAAPGDEAARTPLPRGCWFETQCERRCSLIHVANPRTKGGDLP